MLLLFLLLLQQFLRFLQLLLLLFLLLLNLANRLLRDTSGLQNLLHHSAHIIYPSRVHPSDRLRNTLRLSLTHTQHRVLQSYALHARRTHRRGLCSNALRVVFVRAYHIASQRKTLRCKTLRSRRAHHCVHHCVSLRE